MCYHIRGSPQEVQEHRLHGRLHTIQASLCDAELYARAALWSLRRLSKEMAYVALEGSYGPVEAVGGLLDCMLNLLLCEGEPSSSRCSLGTADRLS